MAYGLIVGLGNPGVEYAVTRHNAGFLVIDAFANKSGLRWVLDKKHCAWTAKRFRNSTSLILAKPTTFMNESGTAVSKLCGYYRVPPTKVVVVYDDIAFPVGDFRIHQREGTGGHNGVADVLSKIGGGFVRYRIGIGAKTNKQMDLKDHVVGRFSEDELKILQNKMSEILDCLQLLLDKGTEHAMNLANRKFFYG
ncbi:MAG: aminoacyl-tRNA hydrolase [Puniceicoccales bacterium]|jgi:PTH1 family peptidyl-tRNA hydrolase|nr:aminoacyl-tRNA hydrolase [Puniceicoccales bacterium]